jgi:hypothetical protein
MQRISQIAIVFVTASSLALAQNPGWRHMGDPGPGAADPQAQAQDQTTAAAADQQNPEPIAPPDSPQRPAANPAPATTPAPAQAAAPAWRPAPPRVNRPAYGLPAELAVKPGTYVSVRINQALSSDHNQAGDPFTATLMQPLVVDGVVVAHRGQAVYGTVAEVQKHHSDKPSWLKLELTSFTLTDGTQVAVQTQLVSRQGGTTPGAVQAGTVTGTTVAGAAIGGAADWGRGAAIGAGAGAAAGLAGVMLTRNHPTVIYPETALTFQTQSPFTISTARAPQAFRYVGPDDYARAGVQTSVGAQPGARYYGRAYPYPYYAYPYPYYSYPIWGPQYGFGALIIGGRGWGWGGRWR